MLNRQGIALVVSLTLMVIAAGIMLLVSTRAVGELRHSGDDVAIIRTLMLARGGANMGGAVLQGPVRNSLELIVRADSDSVGRWTFGSGSVSSTQPTPQSVLDDLTTDSDSVSVQLQSAIDALICDQALAPDGVSTVTLRIHVTATSCDEALPPGVNLPGSRFVEGLGRDGSGSAHEQTFSLPYVLISEGRMGEFLRRVVIQGEFQFTVGRGSFAKYALFTNVHTTSGGGSIWFTDNTVVDGPVHTNQYYRFHRQAWFGDEVTSAGCKTPHDDHCDGGFTRQGAEFYGQGYINANSMNDPVNPSYTNGYGTHEPQLTGGVDWSASFVPLPQNSLDQKAIAQDEGLYLDDDLYSLEMWAADALGNPLTLDFDGNWVPAATYQYIRACESSDSDDCVTYRYASDGELFQRDEDDDDWESVEEEFNGLIYVKGDVDRFFGPDRTIPGSTDPDQAPPALASFARITLTAEKDVRITGDLKYEDSPCTGYPTRNPDGTVSGSTCDNLDATNVLGVFTPEGDIIIGHYNGDSSLNAPDNVTVQGVLMASDGVVTVEDYNKGSAHGNVHLLGGIIEQHYGAFFTFNSYTGTVNSGFGRRFAYDRRMAAGYSPPYFPTVSEDGVRSIRLYSFGQREQVF